MTVVVFLASLTVLALVLVSLWLDYRRICRREDQRWTASGRHVGRHRG